jgi:predicted DNA-binding protein (MmcQ/YjbR family)
VTPEGFNRFCAGLAHATHVVQWGGSDVWKIGGKVFAIAGWGDIRRGEADHFAVSFKVSVMMYEVLRDHPDCRPAPYLASRGMKWIQYYRGDAMSDDELCGHVTQSYEIVGSGLSKKLQKELGLLK